jgi:hypothetical protein
MKPSRPALAVVCLALASAAVGWLAVRGVAAGQRGAAPIDAPAAVPDVRPSAELASPAGAPAAEGAPAPEGRVSVALASDAARADPAPSTLAAAAPADPFSRMTGFYVQDTSGAPLAGALACAIYKEHGNGTWPSVGDAEGRGEINVPVNGYGLRFVARGYESVEVPLPLDEDPVVVTLRAATTLEVRLPPEAAALGIELLASEPPFLRFGEASWTCDPRVLATSSATKRPKGARGSSAGAADPALDPDRASQGSVTFWGAEGGTYVLTNVRPGLALTLAVVDAHGFALLERTVPPLEAGERRIVELAPALPTRRLAGRVLSADGSPADGAEISIGQADEPAVGSTRTDGDGAFLFEGIAAERVRVVIKHPSHAPLLIPEQPVTEQPLELMLAGGRTVRVVVHGPEGDLVPKAAAKLRERASGLATSPRPAADAIVFEHAPHEELELRVTLGGRLFERSIGPGFGPEVVAIEVPAWQSCTVHLTGAPSPAQGPLMIHLEGVGHVMQRSLSEGERSVRFEVVFPGSYEVSAAQHVGGKEVRWSETLAVEVGAEDAARATLELRKP